MERTCGGFLAARHRQVRLVQALEHIGVVALSMPSAAPSPNRGDE
jgi:hypothetical protein